LFFVYFASLESPEEEEAVVVEGDEVEATGVVIEDDALEGADVDEDDEEDDDEEAAPSGAVKAILTAKSRPSTESFSEAVRAAFWSASFSNSTKPNPFERPERFLTT
jgi:hypothetical protein